MQFARVKAGRMMHHGASLLLVLATALTAPVGGAAGWKPSKNVEIVVASGPGGGQDKTGRLVQQILQTKQMVSSSVVVNKPGGGGTLAWTYLNQHAGDGHYLSMVPAALLTNHILGNSTLQFTDYTPLALLTNQYVTVSVRAESPLKSLRDVMDQLKKDPGAVSISVGSRLGDANHITSSLIGKAAGADIRKMKILVYKSGAEPIPALLGGHIDLLSGASNNVVAHVAAGRIRVLGIASPQRLSGVLADVPTLREQGVNAVVSVWLAAMGPRGMTAEQVAYWDTVFAGIVKTDEWKAGLRATSMEEAYLPSAETRKFFKAQYDELKQVLSELGLAK